MPTTFYFDVAHAIHTHDQVIELSGGMAGHRDIGQLASVLDHIQNGDDYPGFEDKLTHLVWSVIKFHCFSDGNKRSAIALGAHFLELNGYGCFVTHFIRGMENIVVWVAEGRIGKTLLNRLVSALSIGDDYDEALMLDLIDALGGLA